MATLSWLGHSTTKIETNAGVTVYIDPWITQNPACPVKELPKKADLLLITHDHFDHVGDAVELSKRTGAKVMGQPETIERLIQEGLPEENGIRLNIGGTITVQDFSATMVHAFHTSNTGMPGGYIMNVSGLTVYHLGDTGIFGDLKLFGELYEIDYALIPIGGHFTMDYKHGAVAAKLLNTKNVIPVHYKTFPLLLQDIAPYKQEIKRLEINTNVLDLQAGETINL